jgi:hypothetical protein
MKKPRDGNERLGKAAFDGFYKQHPIGQWEDLDRGIQRCWILAATTVVKEKNRLNWEENMAEVRLFG